MGFKNDRFYWMCDLICLKKMGIERIADLIGDNP